MTKAKGPVLFDLDDDAPAPTPAEAPPVPDALEPAPQGQAMTTAAALAARPVSRLARWFWSLLVLLITTVASVAAWNFVTDLVSRNIVLGYAVGALFALFLAVVLMIVVKELSAFARLGRIDRIQHDADAALASEDLTAARAVVKDLTSLYAARDDTKWGRDRLKDREADMFDASALIALADHELLAPLDAAALREVEAASRQVATVTALVPLALADVVAALVSNLRMLRAVATIYGGRTGTLGGWRLGRTVIAHLAATGAVAVGDDLISSVAGGGVLSKVSRRFGEGVVNGALTARVGLVAMDLCRPLPRIAVARPSVGGVVRRALSGLFSRGEG